MTWAKTNQSVAGVPGPRSCARCEYFDGGGESPVREALAGLRVLSGDCLNPNAPAFQTDSHGTCAYFLDSPFPEVASA